MVVERAIEKMVPGVADITTIGGLVKQYTKSIPAGQTQVLQLTLQQLYTAFGARQCHAGGNVRQPGRTTISHSRHGLLRSPEDIGGIVLSSHNARRFGEGCGGSDGEFRARQGVVGQTRTMMWSREFSCCAKAKTVGRFCVG